MQATTNGRPNRMSAIRQYVSQRDYKRDPRMPPPRPSSPQTTPRAPPQQETPRPRPPPPLEAPRTSAEKKQPWWALAGKKVADKLVGAEAAMGVRTERVLLFPGWASRKYLNDPKYGDDAYDIEIYVSGFVVKQREFGILTRSQKGFMKVAKSFAALPRLDEKMQPTDPVLSRSTEDLILQTELPPKPTDEIDVESELRALHDFKTHSRNSSSSSLLSSLSTPSLQSPESIPALNDLETLRISNPSSPLTPTPSRPGMASSNSSESVKRLHRNLETRLYPFWATALPARQVQISLFPVDESDKSGRTEEELALLNAPLLSQTVTTTPEGAFQAKFTIAWEMLCTHPAGIHVAFGPPQHEPEFRVTAELLPSAASETGRAAALEKIRHTIAPNMPVAGAEERIPLTHSQVRVISDIDDTIKQSSILAGARAVFYNVFVRDLKENVIPGMGAWYEEMWRRGVRFHYVSNGPFELLPVIQEFFQLAQLPPGSIRLRFYGTRSIFSGLLTAPASRKRAGVEELLASFPNSRFILVGDSGEQDLELYAEQARLRPDQIIAVYVRDANVYDDGAGGVADPTGARASSRRRTLDPPDAPFARGARKGSVASIVTTLSKEEKAAIRAGSAPASPSSPVPRLRNLSMTPRANTPAGTGSIAHAASDNPYFPPVQSLPEQYSDIPSSRGNSPKLANFVYGEPGTYANGASSSTSSLSSTLNDAEKKRLELQTRVWAARLEMPSHIPLRVFREPEVCAAETREMLDTWLGPQDEDETVKFNRS